MGDNRKYVIVKRMNDEDKIELTSKGDDLIFKERTERHSDGKIMGEVFIS